LKQNPSIASDIEDKIRGANGLDFTAAAEDGPVVDD
jgi:hypothetical protein